MHIPDAASMERVGARVAQVEPHQGVLFIHGELGAGKTTLVRGILRGLGASGPIKSPTYTLVEPYALGDLTVYHIDLYRLSDPSELEYIGIRDYVDDAALFLVEWPERAKRWLPAPDLVISIDILPEGRELCLTPHNALGIRMATAATAADQG